MAISGFSNLLTAGARADLLELQMGMADGLKSKVCEVIDSKYATENMPWLGQVPALQQHDKGEMLISDQISEAAYSASPVTYRASIKVFARDLEDDQTQGIRKRVRQLMQRGLQLDEKLVADEIQGSTTTYNGQAFFSNSHPARGTGGAAFDNLLAGSGTSTANAATDFQTGMSTLASFLDEAGEPINEGGLDKICIVAPFGMRKSLLEALNDGGMVSQTTVVLGGTEVDLYFSSRLDSTDANDWYMFATGLQKPFLFLDRKPLEMAVSDESSDTYIKEGAYIFSVERRAICVPGNPALGVKFVNS